MERPEITEEMIFQCFAAAQQDTDQNKTAASFVDVEEYKYIELSDRYSSLICWMSLL